MPSRSASLGQSRRGGLHDVDRLIRAVRLREEYWTVVGCATEAEAVERKEATGLAVDHAGVGGSILEARRICVVSKTSQMNRPRSAVVSNHTGAPAA